ncbi:MAG: hypothetical protein KJ749_14505 [Planctomycetes bacterium]|nr:hypothetical protein [Planctomycetota bacterium]
MSADPLILGLVLIVGCAALLFAVFCVLGRVIGVIVRGVAALFVGRPTKGRATSTPGGRELVCSREKCRKMELRNGRYCSQCGAPLMEAPVRHL